MTSLTQIESSRPSFTISLTDKSRSTTEITMTNSSHQEQKLFSREDFYHASRPLSMMPDAQPYGDADMMADMGFEEVLLNDDNRPAHASSPVDAQYDDDLPEDLDITMDELVRVNSYDFVLDRAKELEAEQEAADFISQSVNGPIQTARHSELTVPLSLPTLPAPVHSREAGPAYEMQDLSRQDPISTAERGGVPTAAIAGARGFVPYWLGHCSWDDALDYYFRLT